MKTSTLVITLLTTSLVIFISVGILVYLNRGGEHMISITVKSLLLPVAAGLGLLLIEFYKPLESYNKTLHIMLADDPDIMHILNDLSDLELFEGIQKYQSILHETTKDNNDKKLEYDDLKYFIQAFIVDILSDKNQIHWDVDYANEKWFFQTRGTTTSPKYDAEKKPKNITIEDLKNCNTYNPYLLALNENPIFLPTKSKLALFDDLQNLIKIKTRNITVKISIISLQYQPLANAGGDTAEAIRKKLDRSARDASSVKFYGITLKYEIEQKRIKRWSPSTIKEVEWATNNFEYIEQMISWEKFEKVARDIT